MLLSLENKRSFFFQLTPFEKMASKLPDDKEAELIQAFNLYCIFNTETGHFDKSNTSKVSTKLLRNVGSIYLLKKNTRHRYTHMILQVVRAVGMCPTDKELEEAEGAIGGDEFTLDQARDTVANMLQKIDNVDDIIMAYKTMAEDDPDGFIHKDRLWQKMRRRLPTDALTDKLIAEAQPDDKGMIDYKAFVKRQFEVRELSIQLPQMQKEPTTDQVKALLQKVYGNSNGPAYPYKYKTDKELYDELSGHGDETRKFLEFGREQQTVIREAIEFETREKVVEAKLDALRKETNPFKSALILRELDSFYTGHKFVNDLEDLEMPCVMNLGDIKDSKERENTRNQVSKVEAMKKVLVEKWRKYV